MFPWSLWVYTVVIGGAALGVLVEFLNLRAIRKDVPPEFRELYDAERFARSQEYLLTNTRVGIAQSVLFTAVLVALIASGFFAHLQAWSESLFVNPVAQGLAFLGALAALSWLWSLPWGWHHTFVIEQRFGFNRSTPRTFVLDQLRGVLLGVLLGLPLVAGLLAFFTYGGHGSWAWAWGAMTLFQIVVLFVAPVWIMPLFNKFDALPAGELRDTIERYAAAQKFSLQGIFTMDGSKRSTKANAFFTGFGRHRRIVLFDTLVARHTVPELMAVLAHEIGHYRLHHIRGGLIVSTLSTGLLLFAFSFLSHSAGLAAAFGLPHAALAPNLIFFGVVYAPVSSLIGLYSLWRSRVHEFEADAFAAQSYGHARELGAALKKLSAESLSNLTPHPLKVLMEYSHPPVTARLRALAQLES